jgi:Ca2+-transporting ATPase
MQSVMTSGTISGVDHETIRVEDLGHAWHTEPVDNILTRLRSGPDGLTEDDVAERLGRYGPNALQTTSRVSAISLLVEQFKNVLIIILLVATVLSAFLGHTMEAIAITIIVMFAVLLGFVQEYRAERAMEALRRMVAPTSRAIRAGREVEIPASQLVPGDIVFLAAGDRIPADLRLMDAINLQVDESPLTGESVPVEKQTEPIRAPDVPLGDRTNLAYSGTAATYGRGRGVVVATGMETEFGKIAKMLQQVEARRTPLQQNLDRVGRTLARGALVVVAVIVGLGLLRGQPLLDMLVFGIALAVAVVPEALPAVVTISLAIGVQRMAKRHALVRRLPAVETLGSARVICSDKTGTLTKDQMTVRRLAVSGHIVSVTGTGYEPDGQFFHDDEPGGASPDVVRLLRAACLASDARLTRSDEDGSWQIQGDPTEGAMVVAAAKAGLLKADLDTEFPRVDEIPFTSETKRMTTIHTTPDGVVAYMKGAPEVVLESCTWVAGGKTTDALDAEGRQTILETATQMAGDALRVLAVAVKPDATRATAEEEMTLLGLVGILDPPRPEAKTALERCRAAGIRVVMITGDHPHTASAVAAELGMSHADRVVTGAELNAMSDEQLAREVSDIGVFARVSPRDKLRIVGAWQSGGFITAMTGDGVNDAPALKQADIGVAMGITGTDVSKEAAAMSLTDDNFASIVAAVEEGRGIYDNIKKYLSYLLAANIGEIGLVAGAAVFGLPLPLTAVQILYVNLLTDGLPALALAVDPPTDELMRRPPRDPRTGVWTRSVVTLMIVAGGWSTMVNVGLFAWALSARGVEHAMALVFVTLVLIEFAKAYAFRSDRYSVARQPFANKWLNRAVAWELVVLAAVVYSPWLQVPLGTFAFSAGDWLLAAGLAATVLPVLDLTKWVLRRGTTTDEILASTVS